MKDGGEADLSAETMPGISGELMECFGGGAKENVVDDRLVAQRDGVELMRHGEDHMEVVGRQDTLVTLLQPPGLVQGLAFGAMPIAA